MTKPPAPERFDWRIWLGLVLTFAWLILGGAYVSASIGWGRVGSLDAATLGNFLEGAFAPLAFLWLVIGYFLQRKELEQNTAALRAQAQEIQRTADQAIIQSEQMATAEQHTRQQVYMQLAQSVRQQLGSIAGLLYLSSQGAAGDGVVSQSEMSKLFSTMSAHDPEIFSWRLVQAHFQQESPGRQFDLFYGTQVRARHTNHFIVVFERLLKRSAEVDPAGLLADALTGSGHGLVHQIMKTQQAKAPRELADAAKTGVHIHLINPGDQT